MLVKNTIRRGRDVQKMEETWKERDEKKSEQEDDGRERGRCAVC